MPDTEKIIAELRKLVEARDAHRSDPGNIAKFKALDRAKTATVNHADTLLSLAEEAVKLREIVGKLPVTADGKRVVLGMEVWFNDDIGPEMAVVQRIAGRDVLMAGDADDPEWLLHAETVYSSLEACVAAPQAAAALDAGEVSRG